MKEKKDSVSFKVCILCDGIKELKPNANTIDCEFTFNNTDVSIKSDSFTTVKAYDWDEKKNILEFYFSGVELKFQVLKTNDPKHLVLKNNDNTLIFLTKK